MKPLIIASILSLGLVTGALAQTSNEFSPARPNDPSVLMNKPDAILPSPCGLGPTVATVANFDALDAAPTSPDLPSAGRGDGVQLAELLCAGNARSPFHADAPPPVRPPNEQ
jgi:hypothetical protein